MKILGIDTSTKFLSIGACDASNVYEYNIDAGRALSSIITLSIKRVIDALGWKLKDVDYFSCGLGPGSFTGLRVGIAAIKGLAWATEKPLIPIPSLEILAAGALDHCGYIVPLIDAKRGLVYSGLYKADNNRLKKAGKDMLISVHQLVAKIKKNRAVFLGDGLNLYKADICRSLKNAEILDKDYWYPRGSGLIALAKQKLAGAKITNAHAVKPVYLYPKECQIANGK